MRQKELVVSPIPAECQRVVSPHVRQPSERARPNGEESAPGQIVCCIKRNAPMTVPSVFTNAKKMDGFVEITSLVAGKRIKLQGFICENCRQVLVNY